MKIKPNIRKISVLYYKQEMTDFVSVYRAPQPDPLQKFSDLYDYFQKYFGQLKSEVKSFVQNGEEIFTFLLRRNAS